MARFFKDLAFNDGEATQAYLTIFSCAPCSPPCIIPLAEEPDSPPHLDLSFMMQFLGDRKSATISPLRSPHNPTARPLR